jgi:hypothetical protein
LKIDSTLNYRSSIITVRSRAQIDSARVAVAGKPVTLIATDTIKGNIRIDSNMTLEVSGKGYFKKLIASDSLVINGTLGNVPNRKWIDTGISVRFGPGSVSSVHVGWFGDSTNWSLATQRAVNTGLPVLFSARTYLFKSAVHLQTEGQLLHGDGTTISVIGKNFYAFRLGETEAGALSTYQTLYIRIEGIKFLGDTTTGSGGLFFRKASRCQVLNCNFSYLGKAISGDGYPGGSNESICCEFRGNTFSRNAYAFFDSVGSFGASVFDRNNVEANKHSGIITKSRNMVFSNNTIESNGAISVGGSGFEPEVKIYSNVGWHSWVNNYFESEVDSLDCFIQLADGELTSSCKISLIGGIFGQNKTPAKPFYIFSNRHGKRPWTINCTDPDFSQMSPYPTGVLFEDSASSTVSIRGHWGASINILAGMTNYQKAVVENIGAQANGTRKRNVSTLDERNDWGVINHKYSNNVPTVNSIIQSNIYQWNDTDIAYSRAYTGYNATNKKDGYLEYWTRGLNDTIPKKRMRISDTSIDVKRPLTSGKYTWFGADGGGSPYVGAAMHWDSTKWVTNTSDSGMALRMAGGYASFVTTPGNVDSSLGLTTMFQVDAIHKIVSSELGSQLKAKDTASSTSSTTGALIAITAGIKHAWVDSLHARRVLSDSARIGSTGTMIINMHRRTDTMVIKFSATDSLCLKAVTP